jgi:Lon protease-like protein
MVDDSLDAEGFISMGVFKPGSEKDDTHNGPIYKHGCLGRIIDKAQLPGGRLQVAVQGVREVLFVSEQDAKTNYRMFDFEYPDFTLDLEPEREILLRREIYERLDSFFFLTEGFRRDCQKLCKDLDFLPLINNLAYLLPLDISSKLKLLRANRVSERGYLLLSLMEHTLSKLAESKNQKPIIH